MSEIWFPSKLIKQFTDLKSLKIRPIEFGKKPKDIIVNIWSS